ncbi:MAG: AAA family ATPase [Saprospiraceae bacterium]|nr:AAA family ATPase [Saprospiraceae bacterium]
MWKFPKYQIDTALDWNDLSNSYSWIDDMKGVQQDPIWHAEGDVYIHTKMVTDELMKLPEYQTLSEQDKHILLTSALFHDIEKRSTTTEEEIGGEVRIVSPRHAKKGEYTTRQLLYSQFNVPFQIREQICKLVRLHGLPLWAISKENPDKEVIYSSTVVHNRLLSMLATADVLGRKCQDQEDILLKIDLFKELCIDNHCFQNRKEFKSKYGRFLYFNRRDAYVDYAPFDDLKCTVTVMCALPGSGKDTYIKKNLDQPVLSLDDIRREHKIFPNDKKGNGQVIQLAKEKAKEYLRAKTSFVFNATNITRDMRSRWIGLFTDYHARVKIIYIEVPYKTLLKQNSDREHKVPENVIHKLIGKLEMPDFKEAHEVEYIIEGEKMSLTDHDESITPLS